MTIYSIAQLAVQRRSGPAQQAGQGVLPAAAPGGVGGEDADASTAVLARAVPSDIIAFYTALIGLLQGIVSDSHAYLPLRWSIYGFTLVATIAAITVASHFAAKPAAAPPGPPLGPPMGQQQPAHPGLQQPAAHPGLPRQRWWKAWLPPTAETITAAFAFAVWGLITPASPLYAILSSPVLPITIGILTAGGVLVMNIVFSPILSRKVQPG